MSIDHWATWFTELWPGYLQTLKLTVTAVLLGLVVAVGFAAATISKNKAVSWLAIGLVEIGRGVPALVLLYIINYGLPEHGLTFSTFVSAALALGLNAAAYMSEILRVGYRAVPRGQVEAGLALGYGRGRLFFTVIAPQVTRIVIGPLLGFSILLMQGSALAYSIGLGELLNVSYDLSSQTAQPLGVLCLAGLMYAATAFVMSLFVSAIESRDLARR